MAPPLLTLQDTRLTLGGKPLLEGADLSVSAGERLCLVGRNGSGKSTLLKIAAGELEADGGVRFLQPNASLRTLPQEPDLSGFASVLAYVEAGLGPGDDPHRAVTLLNELGLTGDEDPAHLSGGEARRAALVRVIAPDPDILLLDEPTNHLDLPAIAWLEGELKSMRGALVVISHDRRFLQTLSRATVWIDRGRTRRLEQGFTAFEAWRDDVLEQEERDRHKLDRRIAMEEDWVRYGVTARRKRNQGRLAKLADLRQASRDDRRASGDLRMVASDARVSGKLVVEAERVGKAYDGHAVVRDVSLRLARGDRLGVIGANGAGKTTLVSLFTGKLAPDQGTSRLGANVEIASLDQGRTSLDPSSTLADALTGGGGDTVTINGQSKHVVGYMKDFLFGPEQARTPVGRLSGGERGRLTLARALALPSNLLVLDEPTNDLDLETLDLLQGLLADYAGTIIVVSHDRDFLDRVVTSVIAAEGDGRWVEYAGGYSDMVAQRGHGVDGATPGAKASRSRGGEAASRKADTRQRLSFAQQHALKTLPGKMDALRAVMVKAQGRLADGGLYARDPKAFSLASKALGDAQAALVACEDEWLELELLREQAG